MNDFELLLKEIKNNLLTLVKEKYQNSTNEPEKDITNFIEKSKVKLERWTTLLKEDKLSKEEFQWLMQSQKDLFLLQRLQESGISKISLGHFKSKLIKTIIDTVFIVVL